MKIYRWIPFALLACLALFAGQWTGKTMLELVARFPDGSSRLATSIKTIAQENMAASAREEIPTPTSEQPVPPDPRSQPKPATAPGEPVKSVWRQFNILVLVVDNLKARNPVLTGAWLVIYPGDQSNFMLLPLFPAQQGSGQTPLVDVFSLDAFGNPGQALLDELAGRDILWSGYLVLDHVSLAEILDYSAGKSYTSGAAMLDDLPDPGQDALGALMQQARLARSLCLSANQLSANELWRITRLYERIRAHVRSDADLEHSLPDLETRLQRGGITCEFPSLAAAMLLP